MVQDRNRMAMNNRGIIKLLSACDVISMEDAKRLLCGKKVGSGAFRDVFELRQDDRYVVKIEREAEGMWANITEFRNWINSWGTPTRQWLCPIEGITDNGNIMIMLKAELKPKLSQYPKHMPACFTDFKIENYGFIEGRCVAIDYSFMMIPEKNRKVNWWSIKTKGKKKLKKAA